MNTTPEEEEIAWAVCPMLRMANLEEQPVCKRCPDTIMTRQGSGTQMCRLRANEAARAVLALHEAGGETIGRKLIDLEDQFRSLAREYRGYLPDSERGFGTPDSRTREMQIEDRLAAFRRLIDAVRANIETHTNSPNVSIARSLSPSDGEWNAAIEEAALKIGTLSGTFNRTDAREVVCRVIRSLKRLPPVVQEDK